MTIISFPNTLHSFDVDCDMPKGTLASVYFGAINFETPITLRAKDVIVIDVLSGKPELVNRQGVVIWRACWSN